MAAEDNVINMDTESDKLVERERYNRRAEQVLIKRELEALATEGAEGIPLDLRTPYIVYEECIQRHTCSGVRVLDLCCGNGQHSLTSARIGASVTVSDIAPRNVELALARAVRVGLSLDGVVGDAEHLPIEDASFDVVTCAGSLSYLDFPQFMSEVRRVIRPGGTFICVDSLNHNPIYRLNRRIHYWRGERSLSVIERTPTLKTVYALQRTFPASCQVSFHGVFSFLAPLMQPLCGSRCTAQILDRLDQLCPAFTRRFAFKFVFCGSTPQNSSCVTKPLSH